MPAEHTGPQGVQEVVPARHLSPPKLASSGPSFIVGVPASADAYRRGKYVQDGYGGVEALMLYEGLSAQDLEDLATLFAQDGQEDRSIHELILRPHPGPPPSLVCLEAELGSLIVRREVASLLRQYPPKRLAERVFYTVACLRRLFVRYREMSLAVQGLSDDAVENVLRLKDHNAELERTVQFLNENCEREVADAVRAARVEKANLETEFRRLTDEHLAEKHALASRIDSLDVELTEAKRKIADLEARPPAKKFKADELMGFLHENGTELRGNWPKLRELFKHFEDGTKPSSAKVTWLQTEVVGQPYRVYSPYTGPPPRSDDGDDEDSGKEEESEDSLPPSPKPTRRSSRSRTPSKKTSTSKPGRGSSSKKSTRPANQDLQLRPAEHVRDYVGCRPAGQSMERTITEACKALPKFVAWQDLRFDVQVLMLTGVEYDKTIQRLGEDRLVHDVFPLRDLLRMLASMMYWHALEDTPWARFVPNSFYLQAEALLDRVAGESVIPFKWPPLESSVVPLLSPSSNEQDNPDDQDYDDDAERAAAKAAKSVEEASKNVINLDVDSDDEGDVVKPGRQSRSKRLHSSDSSSSDEGKAKSKAAASPTPTKRPRRASLSGSTSSSKTPSAKKRKSRAAKVSGLCTQSPLARIDFENLTTAELAVVERPGPGIRSWRIRGVRAGYSPKKGDHTSQTPGFPDYAPQKQDVYILAERWNVEEYKQLLATKPWKVMWRNRVKVLYFHRRSELSKAQLKLLDSFLEYVKDHLQAFWEILHWLIMKTKAIEDDEDDDTDYTESIELYQERTQRHESVGRKIEKRVQGLIDKGLSPTIFEEPGVWTYPVMVCYWFVKDVTTVKADGNPFTLAEQLAKIDQAEPGCLQWADCTDEVQLAHIPDDLKAKLLPANERANNWVSERIQ